MVQSHSERRDSILELGWGCSLISMEGQLYHLVGLKKITSGLEKSMILNLEDLWGLIEYAEENLGRLALSR